MFVFLIILLVNYAHSIDFISARKISFKAKQYAVASGDLNKDGFPDIVIDGDPIGAQLGKIRVLLGKGNGNFQGPKDKNIQSYKHLYNKQLEAIKLRQGGS